MSLAVCLLIGDPADAAIRHLPHLTLAALRTYSIPDVQLALAGLPVAAPDVLHLDALGAFRRSRCWLAPAASADLVARQAAVVETPEPAEWRVGWVSGPDPSPQLATRRRNPPRRASSNPRT